jgi:hypothetical protein
MKTQYVERIFVKFTDKFSKKGFSKPIGDEDSVEIPAVRRNATYEARSASIGGTTQKYDTDYAYGKSYGANEGPEEISFYAGAAADEEFNRLQDRIRRGKVKICDGCGGVMNKTSRMILSPFAGFVLVALGAALMFFYGLATNFYQPPWFLKFILPSSYYAGSIFITVGVLFFFIREKVWICHKCKDIRKR